MVTFRHGGGGAAGGAGTDGGDGGGEGGSGGDGGGGGEGLAITSNRSRFLPENSLESSVMDPL